MTHQASKRYRIPWPRLPWLLLPLLSGCTSIALNMPAQQFESPEVRGKALSGQLEAQLNSGHELVLVPDYTMVPPPTGAPAFNSDTNGFFGIAGRLGVAERVDVGVKTWSTGVPTATVKVQIVGEPRISAAEGNVAVSIFAGGGFGRHYGSGTGFDPFATKQDSNFEEDVTHFSVSPIVGYRAGPSAMLYFAPRYHAYRIKGFVEQPKNSGRKYEFSGDAHQYAVGIGVEHNPGAFVLKVEGDWSIGHYAGRQQTGFSLGVSGGVSW